MKISTQLGYAGGFERTVAEVQEFERAGLDTVWVAEAYGFDAPSLMGFLAAKTERVGTCTTNRRSAVAESQVQITKKARRSAVAKSTKSGRFARSVTARRRPQSVAKPNT